MAGPNANRKIRAQKGKRYRIPVWPASWLAGVIVVVAFGVAALLHIHSKLVVVELGYKLSVVNREHKKLISDQRKLQVEAATLRNPRRLRNLAVQQFQLFEPVPEQIVRKENKREGKVAMGKNNP